MLEVEFSLRCLKSNMYSQLLMVRILVFPQNSCKSRKSRDTWSNRQIWTRRTKQSRAKPNRLLPRKCTGDRKYLLPTTQEKMLHMNITRWSIPKQIDYILCSQRWRSFIQSAKTRLGADCGSDHELLIAKFILK